MSEYVILDASGRFLAGFALNLAVWTQDAANARVWERVAPALKAAKMTRELCEIVEDYGVETQRTIDTIG